MLFATLAQLVTRRAACVVVAAALLGAAAALPASGVSRALAPFGFEDPDTESVRARDRLVDATGAGANAGLVVLVRPADRAKAERVAAVLGADPAVARAVTAWSGGGRDLVARDGSSTYVAAFLRDDSEDAARRLQHALAGLPGVIVGGGAIAVGQVEDVIEEDLVRAELIAFPLLLLLSFWVFRGLVAAMLPPLVGGLTIVLSLAAIRGLAEVTELSALSLNLVTGLGLALSVDWTLLIVSRYREERDIGRTLATAGRTVLLSALTVSAALASMTVFPQAFLHSMGIGGALVPLVAAAVSLVVLPALLVLLGRRLDALAPRRWRRGSGGGGWYRLSRFVMRHALAIAVVASAGLLALGLPFLDLRLTTADADVLPESASARQVYDALQEDYDANRLSPVIVVVEGGGDLVAYAARLGRLEGVAEVGPPVRVGSGLARIDVVPDSPVLSDRAQGLVGDIRALEAPFPVAVTGFTAGFVDDKASLAGHLPLAAGLVVGTTLVLVFVLTGSVVLPLKTLLMNVLTLAAAFGVLVLVFQSGEGGLHSSPPILLFALVFGLSTDYGIFLLARIKEGRDAGLPNEEAVARGLERTGRVITAAALLFCVAIGAFSTSRIVTVRELGVGTGFAVAVDATIVRALLVPSLMKLLGNWNWWAPSPLRRLHERLDAAWRSH
jgi:uncharacterized membrane protein YdfJ with MMPL/SSD domain